MDDYLSMAYFQPINEAQLHIYSQWLAGNETRDN